MRFAEPSEILSLLLTRAAWPLALGAPRGIQFGYSDRKSHKNWCALQSQNSQVNLIESTIYTPAPGWRNWQTQRTQNPPDHKSVGVQLPLPAPALTYCDAGA